MSFIAVAIGTSVVGGVASAVVGSNAAKSAAKTSADATAESNKLSREVYAENKATLAPFVAQGGAATAYINQLLGIQSAPVAQPQPAAAVSPVMAPGTASRPDSYGDIVAGAIGRRLPSAQPAATATPGNTALAPGAAANAFDAYRNSTGYDFRFNEGQRALNNGLAVRGASNSGAADKARIRYGQGIASSEFDNYYNRVAGQQGVGLSAASAQAGVANNYSAQVTQNNAVNASNQGNAAIAGANIAANAINGVTGTIGYIAGRKF
jgi:hypothetical protein